MAKLIILEGLSRTGKTTISNNLKNEGIGRIISLKEKRPEDCDVASFYKGIGLISNEFYKAFPEETFILDRSFLSEFVYSKFFRRPDSTNREFVEDLLTNNEVIQFYLHNTYEDYLKRSPKDRYIYTEEDYSKITNLFERKLFEYKTNTLSIDTSKNDLQQVYNLIKNHI